MQNRNDNSNDMTNLDSEASREIANLFLKHLKEEHQFSDDQIGGFLRKLTDLRIPVSIFNVKLSSLETITKYLIENKKKKNHEVAKLLNRNPKTIWSTYQNANKKYSGKFVVKEIGKFSVPISELEDRTYSVLEVIVRYLREHYSLSFKEIARLTKRSPGTLGTVYFRAKKKENYEKKFKKGGKTRR